MEDDNVMGFQTEDLPTLFFVYLGTNASMGFMIGWAVSLFTKCGTFDTWAYVDQMLKASNCTNPPTTSYCYDIQHTASREASDQALRMCFYYCGWGTLWGVVFTFVTLCLACTVLHRHTFREYSQLMCDHISQWKDRIVVRLYQWRRQVLRHRPRINSEISIPNNETDHNLYQPPLNHPESPKSPLTPQPLDSSKMISYTISREHPQRFYHPPVHHPPIPPSPPPPPLNYIHTYPNNLPHDTPFPHYTPLSPGSPLTPRDL